MTYVSDSCLANKRTVRSSQRSSSRRCDVTLTQGKTAEHILENDVVLDVGTNNSRDIVTVKLSCKIILATDG
jgi:mRNA-degrading endonuclease HigB of HigAB toxin-antitoxin module